MRKLTILGAKKEQDIEIDLLKVGIRVACMAVIPAVLPPFTKSIHELFLKAFTPNPSAPAFYDVIQGLYGATSNTAFKIIDPSEIPEVINGFVQTTTKSMI